MDVVILILGVVLVVVPAVDLFRELFQPRGRGVLSHAVARIAWRLLDAPARRSPRIADFVGPGIMLSILLTWLISSMIGWALVFSSAMAGDAFTGHGDGAFLDALYLSMVTISTLGYGDVVPTADWARIIVPLEALFGLGVAAGTIGWLMNVHPVLSHRSTLASKVVLLEQAERGTGLVLERVDGAHGVLADLTSHIASVHSDLLHFPVSYYFYTGERLRSLPAQVETMLELADRCARSADELTRLHAAMLETQLRATIRAVAREFLRLDPTAPSEQLLDAWRRDHELPTATATSVTAA